MFCGLSAFLMIAVLSIAGCASTDETSNDTAPGHADGSAFVATTRYDCGGGGRLTVEWAKALARVTLEGVADRKTWRLPRALSGSGARYSDGMREVWEHQGELRWTDAGAAPRVCRRFFDRK